MPKIKYIYIYILILKYLIAKKKFLTIIWAFES